MQQAIYNNISIPQSSTPKTTATAAAYSGLLRWVACRWDMAGVLALMGSSAAYGVYALAHLGL